MLSIVTKKPRNRPRPFPRKSGRFPQLSSAGWLDVRADRAKAKKVFAFYDPLLKPLRARVGLSLSRRVELLALVFRLHNLQGNWLSDRYVRAQLGKARTEARRRSQKINWKVAAIVSGLRELADYIEPLAEELFGTTLLGVGVMELPAEEHLPWPQELREQASRYERMRILTAGEVQVELDAIGGSVHASPRREVLGFATAQLTDFFSNTCHLSKQEADVRTAEIGNKVLGWDVPFQVRTSPLDPVGRGSETIRSRRRRRVAAGGQPPKKVS